MHIVYILQSQKDKSYYTGVTADLEKRLAEHNAGSVLYTSSKRPYWRVWHCSFPDRDKAIKFEKYLKYGSGFAFARKRLV